MPNAENMPVVVARVEGFYLPNVNSKLRRQKSTLLSPIDPTNNLEVAPGGRRAVEGATETGRQE